MHVVIKAFSRPFYLDRCLSSIRSNLDQWSGVTILDDGLPEGVSQRLIERYPEFRFVRAPWAGVKYATLKSLSRNQDVTEQVRRDFSAVLDTPREAAQRVILQLKDMNQLSFWREQISLIDDPYILLIEEDTWLVEHLDLSLLERGMRDHRVPLAHMIPSGRRNLPGIPALATVGEAATLSSHTLLSPTRSEDGEAYFIVALAAFERRYWLAAHDGIARWLPEEPIRMNARVELDRRMGGGEAVAIATITPWPLRQSTTLTTTLPASHFGRDITLYDVTDALTEAWWAGELEPFEGYPDDFPREKLGHLIAKELGAAAAGFWARFHEDLTHETRLANQC